MHHYITTSLHPYITISLHVLACVQGDVEASGRDQDYITGAETVNGDQEVKTKKLKTALIALQCLIITTSFVSVHT